MKKKAIFLMAVLTLILLLVMPLSADAALRAGESLAVVPHSVRPFEQVTLTYKLALSDDYAWIGLFKKGSRNDEYIEYKYISPPTNGYSSGKYTITAPAALGEYEFRVIDSSDILVFTSDTFKVEISASLKTGESLTVSPLSVRPLEQVTLTYKLALSDTSTWIGLFKKGSADDEYIEYMYINPPADGYTGGQFTVKAPAALGEYEFRVIDGGDNLIFTSASFKVEYDSTAGPAVPPATTGAENLKAAAGADSITLQWNAASNTNGLLGYNLYRGTAPGGESTTPVTDFPITGVSYTDKNVDMNTTYYYIMRPVYTGNTLGQASNEAGATVGQVRLTIVLKIGDHNVVVNGQTKPMDTPPVVVNGRSFVPIRSIIEEMGGTVSWEAGEQKVTITVNTTVIELRLNSKTAKVNGESRSLDVAPFTKDGRTMLPLRFIIENLGCTVDWDGVTQTVTIKY